jgi:DNA-binding CsgD family transcriptional regulator
VSTRPGRLAGVQQVIEEFALAYRLSDREREVIRLAASGLCTKEIGVRLGCATATVHTYWTRIYNKLSCRSREQVLAQLLAFVADHAPSSPHPPPGTS